MAPQEKKKRPSSLEEFAVCPLKERGTNQNGPTRGGEKRLKPKLQRSPYPEVGEKKLYSSSTSQGKKSEREGGWKSWTKTREEVLNTANSAESRKSGHGREKKESGEAYNGPIR